MRMSLQPMLERVISGVETKKAVLSTSCIVENEAVSLIGMSVCLSVEKHVFLLRCYCMEELYPGIAG